MEQQPQWIDKHEAAKSLNMSTRSVLALAQAGEIQSKREIHPQNNQLTVMLHAGDVERIRHARANPGETAVPRVKMQPLHTSGNGDAQAALVQALNSMAERIAMAALPAADLKEPHFLTLKQARDISGLPVSFLHSRFVATGLAVRTGAGWRIARTELERFARETNRTGVGTSQTAGNGNH
jgi:hypothetical protein